MLALTRRCQSLAPCPLGGGAALSGVYLRHRLSRNIDIVCRDREQLQSLERELPELARAAGTEATVVVRGGTFVRARVAAGFELDVVVETTPPIEAAELVEGILVVSLADLRAAKLTCLLSRSEPRDLVDILFLDRAGFPPEADIPLALRKDAGMDPGVLAWLLGDFPLEPLPKMLLEITQAELAMFRDDLRERLRRAAVPEER